MDGFSSFLAKGAINEVHYVDIVHLALRREVSRDRAFAKLGCDELQAASLAALSSVAQKTVTASHAENRAENPEFSRKFARTMLTETCMTCHSGSYAPKLPFASEPELKTALRQSPAFLDSIRDHVLGQNGAEPMPLGDPLPKSEADQMVEYLESLAREP